MGLGGWNFYNPIVVDNTKVGSNLTNFPARVHLDSTNFDFTKALSTGNDIRFTAADGVTLLDYEREQHDAANQLAEYWVKVPSVSSTVNTNFTMYCGNGSAVDGANPTAVWGSNYAMVQHMKDATTSTILDSTINANNGTKYAANSPIQTVGKIGEAQSFNLNSIALPILNVSAQGSPFYISVWIKTTQVSTGGGLDSLIFSKRNGTNTFNICINNGYLDINNWSGVVPYDVVGTTIINDNIWHKVGFGWDGTTIYLYVDGVLDTSSAITLIQQAFTNGNSLGAFDSGTTRQYVGLEDEVRAMSLIPSADWIKASYNSENNTLLTVQPMRTNSNALFFGMSF